MMPFRTRNSYYLRISKDNVLPLYVYLDERHLEWMSDRILQHVLADLRPNIVPKLKAEADAHLGPGGPSSTKRATVDTHRGDNYQFCYFVRKTDPHSVLVKTRTFVAAPPLQHPPPVSSPQPQRVKRKARTRNKVTTDLSVNARKKRKTKGKDKTRMDGHDNDEDDEELTISSSVDDRNLDQSITSRPPGRPLRRSGRTRSAARSYYEQDEDSQVSDDSGARSSDVEMVDQVSETATLARVTALSNSDLDNARSSGERNQLADVTSVKQEVDDISLITSSADIADIDASENQDISIGPSLGVTQTSLEIDEEEKPKPILQLEYQGFGIYGRCLCIVVEPWPPVRSESRAPSAAPTLLRDPSVAPADFALTGEIDGRGRERTPLFLPDDFDRDRSETPAPFLYQRVLPPVPLFNDRRNAEVLGEDDFDGGGMMEFSQILNAAGDFRTGAANDDEGMEGAAFFGDADERRELQ